MIKAIDLYHLMLYPYSPKCRQRHITKSTLYLKRLSRKTYNTYYEEKYYEKSSSIGGYHYDSVRKHNNQNVTWYGKNKVLLPLSWWYPIIKKPEDIQLAQDFFKSFHKNLCFTVDKFENEVLHFLDSKISAQGLTNYHKNIHTEQYAHYDSFIPWSYKISSIRRIVTKLVVFVVKMYYQ